MSLLFAGIAPIISAMAGGTIGCGQSTGDLGFENLAWIAIFSLPLAFVGLVLTAAIGILARKKSLRIGQILWLLAVANTTVFVLAIWFLRGVSGV